MATVHLIHGFLGCGKTTLARRLAAEHRAVRFSPDEVMVERHGVDPPAEHFAEYKRAIFAEMNAQWPAVIATGVDVVLDSGLWTRAERDAARARAASLGAQVRLYWVRCSEETARARCRARNAGPEREGSLYIAENTFDVLKKRYEPLAEDEPFTLVDTETSDGW
jgi:predicted kinase